MSTTVPTDHNPRQRWIIYTAVSLVALILLAIMIPLYHGHHQTKSAQDKAQQLSAAIEKAGYPAPDVDALAGVLGTDGGAVCAATPEGLTKAVLQGQISNGATGPGMRPVITSKQAVAGQRLIIQIYCPERLDEYDLLVESLNFADVVKQ
jgi:hypothetical protein